jgi:hypothetical protein
MNPQFHIQIPRTGAAKCHVVVSGTYLFKSFSLSLFSSHSSLFPLLALPFPYSFLLLSLPLLTYFQEVTKICRLPWLTNCALVNEPKCGGDEGRGLQGLSCAHGAQINFENSYLYLTYTYSVLIPLLTLLIVMLISGIIRYRIKICFSAIFFCDIRL